MSSGRKPSPPLDYQKRDQHGDPIAARESQDALTAEELMGKPSVEPVKSGPIAMPKRCGWCGEGLPATASHCPKCVPSASQFIAGMAPANLGAAK